MAAVLLRRTPITISSLWVIRWPRRFNVVLARAPTLELAQPCSRLTTLAPAVPRAHRAPQVHPVQQIHVTPRATGDTVAVASAA